MFVYRPMQQRNLERLKNENTWITWNYGLRGGKRTKIPFAPMGGPTGTNKEYHETWRDYKTACQKGNPGLVLQPGYFMLDIDGHDLNDPVVVEMIDRFSSYTEISPSGNGIHVLGMCDMSKLPPEYELKRQYYQKNSVRGIELYLGSITNRFGTFTGEAINHNDLTDCTDAIYYTLEHEMKRLVPVQTQLTSGICTEETKKLISLMSHAYNTDWFEALYYDGDFKRIGYNSQSEADLALCGMIARYANFDREKIDEVFRSSALYREKWNRKDYRENTIEMACRRNIECVR